MAEATWDSITALAWQRRERNRIGRFARVATDPGQLSAVCPTLCFSGEIASRSGLIIPFWSRRQPCQGERSGWLPTRKNTERT